jgi:hypothetical protein
MPSSHSSQFETCDFCMMWLFFVEESHSKESNRDMQKSQVSNYARKTNSPSTNNHIQNHLRHEVSNAK